MLLPSIFGENLLDDWMDFPRMNDFPAFTDFPDIDRKLYGRKAAHVMKTDIHENDEGYELDIDLPGFKKDEISITLEDGYLSVSAAKGLDKEKKNHQGRVIRQERYAGSMQRSFDVGEKVKEEDIKASFKHGILTIFVWNTV